MIPDLRILVPGDEPRLDTFLQLHAASSLFLRSNMLAAGLVDTGRALEGTYAARVSDGRIEGVVAHFWNGNLVVQAPSGVAEIARHAVKHSGRRVKGIIGPWEQTLELREGLGLAEAETNLVSREDLLSLELDAMRVPAALTAGRVISRRARSGELPLLAQWRHDYNVELAHEPPGDALLEAATRDLEKTHERGWLFVLEEQGQIVAMSIFNARLPDCVQIGGVWTPPVLRGRGHARAVVAGSLLIGRAEGITSSVLFTDEANVAARTAYLSIGYQRVGNYGVTLFREGHRVE